MFNPNYPDEAGEAIVGVTFASLGYVAAMPDYLGLGDSDLDFHPYHDAFSEATAVIDMLRAARIYCANNSILLNNQLFLCGYSQGGHATMAAHLEIETYHAGEFTVTASAPMAGAYDLSGTTLNDFLSNRQPPNPYYYAYLLVAYNNLYSLGSWSEILKPQYQNIPNYFNGQYPDYYINSLLPPIPHDMLQDGYLQALQTDQLHPLRWALRRNDVYNWTPLAPMRLYHGSSDKDVLYANSQMAYNALVKNGARQVTLVTLSGDHETAYYTALLAAKDWFNSLKR
jgi:predicted esterase